MRHLPGIGYLARVRDGLIAKSPALKFCADLLSDALPFYAGQAAVNL